MYPELAHWYILFALAAPLNMASARQVGPPSDYGIDFVTIGAAGNAPFAHENPPAPFAVGRGQVNYEYRIGRMEITTGQWLEFVNTFWTQGNQPLGWGLPNSWGAVRDLDYQGPGRRYELRTDVPTPELLPIFGITWREAAMYCNWLHNGQSTDPTSRDDGAYDVSTFTFNPDNTFNDQLTHHPDARFWIPTFDEWLKAAHYDPNRFGPDEEGYWMYSHRSDDEPIPGPPGVGETSAGYEIPPFGHYDIPLGAYPSTLSPWGLMDVTGGATEWTEETFEDIYGERRWRFADGNYAGNTSSSSHTDWIHFAAAGTPTTQGAASSLRIASSIPAPPMGCVSLLVSITLFRLTRRRRC